MLLVYSLSVSFIVTVLLPNGFETLKIAWAWVGWRCPLLLSRLMRSCRCSTRFSWPAILTVINTTEWQISQFPVALAIGAYVLLLDQLIVRLDEDPVAHFVISELPGGGGDYDA